MPIRPTRLLEFRTRVKGVGASVNGFEQNSERLSGADGYMGKYTLRLHRKTKYSPQVEGVKLPSEGCAGVFTVEASLRHREGASTSP